MAHPKKKGEAELAAAARRVFDATPDVSRVTVIDHAQATGFYVEWGEKGAGFGTMFFGVDKQTMAPRLDVEGMGPESVARILRRLIGTTVDDVCPANNSTGTHEYWAQSKVCRFCDKEKGR